MVQHANRVAKIHRIVLYRHVFHACAMEHAVGERGKAALRYRKGLFTRVDAQQLANPRSDKCGPPATSTTAIEALGVWLHRFPREHREVRIKHPSQFIFWNGGLV